MYPSEKTTREWSGVHAETKAPYWLLHRVSASRVARSTLTAEISASSRDSTAKSKRSAKSFFVPDHNSRVFVDGECDMVGSIGYNPDRLPHGYSLDEIDIRFIITNLCVMDFGGPNHQVRLVSVHPGVSVDEVKDAWAAKLPAIQNFSNSLGRSVCFSEWGCVPEDTTLYQPWNWHPSDVDDPGEQLAYHDWQAQ